MLVASFQPCQPNVDHAGTRLRTEKGSRGVLWNSNQGLVDIFEKFNDTQTH